MSFIGKYFCGDRGKLDSPSVQDYDVAPYRKLCTEENNSPRNDSAACSLALGGRGLGRGGKCYPETLTRICNVHSSSRTNSALSQRERAKNVKNLVPMCLNALVPIKKKVAFTLAEVLITLGIIGIVAAMTIPTLMTKYEKKRTETQLKAFYSRINQTLKMSAAENGDIGGLVTQRNYSYNEEVEFLKQYIFPYMKHLGYYNCTKTQTTICIYLIDGGLMTFSIDINGGDIGYWTDAKKFNDNRQSKKVNIPRYHFSFQFAKYKGFGSNARQVLSTNFVDPYVLMWDGTKEGLKKNIWACVKGCTNCGYCTKMIQVNDWKIPDDYPW